MYKQEYRRKLTTPEQAVEPIKNSATIVHGMATGEPPALAGRHCRPGPARRPEGPQGLFPATWKMRPGPFWLPIWVTGFTLFCWFVTESPGPGAGRLDTFVPNEFHRIPRLCREFMDIDVVVTAVSPMDKAGFFTFGTINDFISTAARHCKRLIVEVNPQMPRVFGESLLHISEVDAIVENDVPLVETVPAAPKPEAEAIGRAIAAMIPDGATLQLGIGGIPNAVCHYLEGHQDLGIHTELMCPGMVHLIKKGAITGRRKNIHPWKHVFTNAIGDREMYEFMHDNPSMESYPVSYTNDPAVIAQNDNMISINSTIEVDLLGQCNSEFLGGHEFSGTGGQLDYVRGAFNSKGGKSFIAFYATAHNGEISRVVPRFAPGTVVTTPRMDTHYLATEYGVVNLMGKSTRERAMDIINLAHPKFRDSLMEEARKMCLA